MAKRNLTPSETKIQLKQPQFYIKIFQLISAFVSQKKKENEARILAECPCCVSIYIQYIWFSDLLYLIK